MKRLFHPLNNREKESVAKERLEPNEKSSGGEASSIKDFIGKVFIVNKYTVTVEDVIAEGGYQNIFVQQLM